MNAHEHGRNGHAQAGSAHDHQGIESFRRNKNRVDHLNNRPSPRPSAASTSLILSGMTPKEQEAAALDPGTPPTILAALTQSDHPVVRLAAARNDATPSRSLTILSKDYDPTIRAAVADSQSTTTIVLNRLSSDPSEDVRVHIGDNPRTDMRTLTALADDPSPLVRRVVDANIVTPWTVP